MNRDSRKITRVLLQIIVTAVIFGCLLWFVGVGSIYDSLLNIKLEYLLLVFLVYFGINLLFTVRLRLVLRKDGIKTSFGKTLLAQYAGMLTSDVTPGRSGYVLTPLYLKDQEVPTSKSLSGILGIQTIEFLAKVAGGIGAIIFLINTVPLQNWDQFGTHRRHKLRPFRCRFRDSADAHRRNPTSRLHLVSKGNIPL